VPGARFDRDASWGWTFSPRAAALYRVSRAVKLRTSAGRAFRAPTLSELYMPDVSSIPGVILRSNPHLTPETITALDAGAVLEPRDDLVLEVDAFRNDMRDLITLLRAGPTMTYGNLDRARSVGFDSAVAWRPTGAWTLSLNHTWQWVEDRTTGQVLDYMPQNKGHAALRATRTLRGIRFDAQVLESLSGARYYTDSSTRRRVRLDPFAVTNLAVRAGWDDRAFVEVKALNLLDSLYEETGEVPAPGRMVLLTAGAGL
jgi:outer membrane receptor protein involved in Fe transport